MEKIIELMKEFLDFFVKLPVILLTLGRKQRKFRLLYFTSKRSAVNDFFDA